MNNVNITIPLDADVKGMRSMRLTGPHKMYDNSYRNSYILGLFIEKNYPKEDDQPDIEVVLLESDLVSIKNAISSMLVASMSER